MMTRQRTITYGGGVSLSTVVGVVFVILKLTGVIDWSWWWVLAPFWIGVALWGAVAVVGAVLLGVAAGVAFVAEGAAVRRSRDRAALWVEKDAMWDRENRD